MAEVHIFLSQGPHHIIFRSLEGRR